MCLASFSRIKQELTDIEEEVGLGSDGKVQNVNKKTVTRSLRQN